MELTVSSWFNEPKINFKFSHKVGLFIRNEVKEHIMQPLGLLDSYEGKFLNLNVTTSITQDVLEVKLSRKWSNKSTHRTHDLWFPYKPIVESEYPLKEYINCYIESLQYVFEEFGVSKNQIEKVRANVELTILNNSDFELTKEELEEIEEEENLGDLFAKELGIEP